MKITVLGCGAMGQLWLSALFKQGHHLQGWVRVPQSHCHINVTETDGTLFKTSLPSNETLFLAQSELLLVTLKAWQVSDAVKNLAPQLAHDCPILLLHNGMGTIDELQSLRQPLIPGVTTHAAYRSDNTIIHTACGLTRIGPANDAARNFSGLADVLQRALPDVAWHDNISAARWNKLAVNCVINPLTAILNCSNGALRYHVHEVESLCNEVAHVMVREGHHTTPEGLLSYIWSVVDSTAKNISSMLQDIRMRRHTEIDYITGYLLKRARAHGLKTPANARLYDQIKRKENEYERIGAGVPGPWQ